MKGRRSDLLDILESHVDVEGLLRSLLRSTIFQKQNLARDEMGKLASSRSGPDREVATKLAVIVVKQAELTAETHGDISIMSRVLGCQHDYAGKAVASGQEESLLKRNMR